MILSPSALPPGLWPVMLTPFNDDGTINWSGIDGLVEVYLSAGAAGLFACCGSSEMFHLYDEERTALIRHVVARAAGRVPVIAVGNFSGPLAAQLDSIRTVADLGVAAVVLLPNVLTPPQRPEADLAAATDAVLAAAPAAAFGTYECPKPTHRVLSPEFIGRVAASGRFVFHKDTTGNLAAIRAKIAAAAGSRLLMTNAHTPTLLASFRAGGSGVCPIGANYLPGAYARLWAAHAAGDDATAARLQAGLTAIEPRLTRKYPLSAKIALHKLGLPIGRRCRMVDYEWTADDDAQLDGAIADARGAGLPTL